MSYSFRPQALPFATPTARHREYEQLTTTHLLSFAVLASDSRRRSTRLAWRLLFANHKQASTLAAGCSGDIVSTTRSPRRLILVERPKPMSSAFRRQSRWASSPKSQQRPLLRGERSSMSNLFCKASESQPRRSLLLMNAWTSREFALSLPHPPK